MTAAASGRDERGARGPRRDERGGRPGGFRGRDDRSGGGRFRDERDRDREPIKRLPIPEDVSGEELDRDVRQELQSLPKTLAEDVAKNLVMIARLIDEDPEGAYGYSKVALRLASRVAAVREAAGFAAYANQKYGEALAEFRAARRMTGDIELWPVMADCERGLGGPRRRSTCGCAEVHKLDKAGQVEMRLVAAGARRDMGQLDAAIVTLQSPELASNSVSRGPRGCGTRTPTRSWPQDGSVRRASGSPRPSRPTRTAARTPPTDSPSWTEWSSSTPSTTMLPTTRSTTGACGPRRTTRLSG